MDHNVKSVFRIKSAIVTMHGCAFVNNHGTSDGTVINSQGSTLYLTNCIAANNSALHNGGVIYMESSNMSIWNSHFSNNTAESGGVISFMNFFTASFVTDNIYIVNTTFLYNHAESGGDVIYSSYSIIQPYRDVTFESCNITGSFPPLINNDYDYYYRYYSAIQLGDSISLRMAKCYITYDPRNTTLSLMKIPLNFITYRAVFSRPGTILQSTDPDFIQSAVFEKMLHTNMNYTVHRTTYFIDNKDFTHTESPYAAGKHSTPCLTPSINAQS